MVSFSSKCASSRMQTTFLPCTPRMISTSFWSCLLASPCKSGILCQADPASPYRTTVESVWNLTGTEQCILLLAVRIQNAGSAWISRILHLPSPRQRAAGQPHKITVPVHLPSLLIHKAVQEECPLQREHVPFHKKPYTLPSPSFLN